MIKTCGFTGHRFIANQKISKMKKHLNIELLKLINKGVLKFYCGGAIGFDMFASISVLHFQTYKENIELHLILPYKGYRKNWSDQYINEYNIIDSKATSIRYIYPFFSEGCNLDRNKHLVDKSDIILSYCDKRIRSGTKYTINYANIKNIPIINLYNIST